MSDESISFTTNMKMIIVPALFLGGAGLIYQLERDFFWGWLILLIFGIMTAIGFLSQWKVYRFETEYLIISGLFSSRRIAPENIAEHNKKTLTRRGIHYYTWTLKLTNGKTIRILSDYIRDHEEFRRAIGLWLAQKKD